MNAAPVDEPPVTPSDKAKVLAPSNASESVTLTTLSTSDISIVAAIKSLPIPSIS